MIQLGGCFAVGTDGVVEEIAVRGETDVAYCTVAWRDNLNGAVNGDLANPETELAVLIGNIREVAGVGGDASLNDVAGRGQAGNRGILKCGGGHSGMEGASPVKQCQHNSSQDDSSDEW